MKLMPDGDFRLNEMITEDMVADEYDRKTSCQLRFQQTSVEVNERILLSLIVVCRTGATVCLRSLKIHNRPDSITRTARRATSVID